MKIAIIYNRDSQAVINLFGTPNREKYGLKTIEMIKEALQAGGHQVKAFEGDKNIIYKLEEFMPSVISGERPGLVFNLSYGIQGRARYTHIPGILEMLGIPYIGSSPETHAVALDKVMTKIILIQKGLPTPRFAVLEDPSAPLAEDLKYPLIVKPRDEAVSFGLRIVHNEEQLREGARYIYDMFKSPVLVEEYIEGREINVGLLGNDPVEALPPVELLFEKGERIYTYEDKIKSSGRKVEKVCPAALSSEENRRLQSLAVAAFKAIGCFDSARVDFRLDQKGEPYILETNSMASLGPGGSYVYAAEKIGLDYTALANRLIEIAGRRYFGPDFLEEKDAPDERKAVFAFLTQNRDAMEEELKTWTNLPSWTADAVGLGAVVKRFEEHMHRLGMKEIEEFTNRRSAWTWETEAGLKGGTLLVVAVDVPRDRGGGYPIPFRRDPEWLYGEGIASSRAGVVCLLRALSSLEQVQKLHQTRAGVLIYSDEGRGMRYSSGVLRKAAAQAGRVIVLQPGYRGGKVVDQRRGSRKFSILVEGDFLRMGYRGSQSDVLTWFLQGASRIAALNEPPKRLTVAVQDIHTEKFSVLLPHRVRATISVTYLEPAHADEAEKLIREIFFPGIEGVHAYLEKLEERPSLVRSGRSSAIIASLERLSEEWKLPFGVESSLLPSAAGEVPADIPVICGFAPAGQDVYTPYECINRGELLQRSLLLSLYLLEG